MNRQPLLPKRMIDPLWRVRMYIEFRAGMPDPERDARRERMRRLSTRILAARQRR